MHGHHAHHLTLSALTPLIVELIFAGTRIDICRCVASLVGDRVSDPSGLQPAALRTKRRLRPVLTCPFVHRRIAEDIPGGSTFASGGRWALPGRCGCWSMTSVMPKQLHGPKSNAAATPTCSTRPIAGATGARCWCRLRSLLAGCGGRRRGVYLVGTDVLTNASRSGSRTRLGNLTSSRPNGADCAIRRHRQRVSGTRPSAGLGTHPGDVVGGVFKR